MSATMTAAAKATISAAARRAGRKPVSPEAYADLKELRRRWNEVLDAVNDLIADFEDGHVGEHIDQTYRDELYTSLGEIWCTLANDGPKVRRSVR